MIAPSIKEIAEMARALYADNEAILDCMKKQQEREWLPFWSGPQWGDEAPNRLFGAWLNHEGEAV